MTCAEEFDVHVYILELTKIHSDSVTMIKARSCQAFVFRLGGTGTKNKLKSISNLCLI